MSSALRPFRQVLRRLARSPLFSIVTVVTLALAIGANSAVFSVVDGVLLEPLPFDEPEGLVGVWHTAPGLGFDLVNQSPALHFTYLEDAETFESVGMWNSSSSAVTGLDEPEEVPTMVVTHTTLPILRIQPALGRVFNAEDDTDGAPLTVILSHGYWQTHFGGREGVLGETITVEGRAREIIGVMPADLQFLDFDPALYLPFQFDMENVFVGNFSYRGVARLSPGATIEQANAEVDRLVPVAVERYPGGITQSMLDQARFAGRVRPLKEDVVGDVGNVLWVLLGTVGLVLLIACANVANLFLVRADERQTEMAIRTALGASRRRLAGEFLSESLTLGLLGGAVGLVLAWGGVRLLGWLSPQGLPRLDEIGIDPGVLAFTFGLAVLAGLLFGLVPVLRYGRQLPSSLKEGGRGGSAGKERNRARDTLVVVQMALALVLLVGAGLMIRSLMALGEVDPGFQRPGEVLTVRISIPSAEIEEPELVMQAHERVQRNLEAIPGVQSVGGSSSVPMDGRDSNDALMFEGFPVPEGQIPPIRRYKWVTPGYFETLENPVVAGRSFTWADIHTRNRAVVITDNLAREHWDRPVDAIGKRVRQPRLEIMERNAPWYEIVGVVGDVRDDGLDQDPVATVYWPAVTTDFWGEELRVQRTMKFVLRNARRGDPGLLDQVREAIWSVNPSLPLANVETLDEVLARSTARTSFALVMLGIASGAALLLGAVGIYGVTSYAVAQRRREIGVRMALGARPGNVAGLVLRQGLALATVGVTVGLVAAFGLTRLMSALLFEVSVVDPLTYGVVAVAVAAIALLASWVPARRAARVDPIESLHSR